ISTNEKRYLVRKNHHGKRSLWIPIETTLINDGFDEAWSKGALSYLKDAEVRQGLQDGWVQIIDVN
ncbi:MAG: hypothetical protein ACYST3_09725, partial [Planctomycetota bacterium]